MIVYGRNPVIEAMRGPREVRRVWATERAAAQLRAALGGAVQPTIVAADAIAVRAETDTHQGVCAEVAAYRYADADDLLSGPEPLIVVLDEVSDPQNLGAVCRSAECAGATGVVIPERRAAAVTPAVCKASAGAVEHLAVAQVRNVADFLGAAKAHDCWVYGAAGAAGQPYDRPDYRGGVVLVFGAEGRGLRPRVTKACDASISLPLRGKVDSLNVSAATAVVLYEVLQHRMRG